MKISFINLNILKLLYKAPKKENKFLYMSDKAL